jgi:hypothetical protein
MAANQLLNYLANLAQTQRQLSLLKPKGCQKS